MSISAKVEGRIAAQLKRYQSVLQQAKQRDISESDTCVIICDLISDVLGYKKYEQITTEHNIRGNYVDLAVQTDGAIRFLVEVKAIGIPLKDQHVKQAIGYGANEGIEWVVLTNGAVWRIYKLQFSQPIEKILLCEIDVLSTSPKDSGVVECFGNLSLEGFSKEAMENFSRQKEITSKFSLAAVLLTDSMVEALRKEIRRLSGTRVDSEYLLNALATEVIKRELIDGDEGKLAQSLVKRYVRAQAREKSRSAAEDDNEDASSIEAVSAVDSSTASAPQIKDPPAPSTTVTSTGS